MVRKKSNILVSQEQFIKLAFEQAKINIGSTGQNPSVGCVITKNNSVISSGVTSVSGRPHAEFIALNKRIDFRDSNIFITLEPCSHYGLTPPCTSIIIKKKVKKVFFSIFDKDRRSSHKSKKKFLKANISIKTDILKDYGMSFYKDYLFKHSLSLPLIDAKIAISKDYFTKDKKNKWITNEHSRKRVHLLRSRYDCIVSTAKSINDDNSLLNCRLEGLEEKSPSIIIIDRSFNLRKNTSIVRSIQKKIYLFTSTINKSKEKFFKKKGFKIIYLKNMSNKKDYYGLFKKIKALGFSRIFVESGLNFLNFLLLNKFINNIFIFKSDTKISKNGINYASNKLLKDFKLSKKINVNLFNDSLYYKKLK